MAEKHSVAASLRPLEVSMNEKMPHNLKHGCSTILAKHSVFGTITCVSAVVHACEEYKTLWNIFYDVLACKRRV